MAEASYPYHILMRKAETSYCIVIRVEGTESVREGHFTRDNKGTCWINGERHRPANVHPPKTWKALLSGEDVEGLIRGYGEEGWVRVPLDTFECH